MEKCSTKKLLEFISRNVQNPPEARKNNISGMVVAQFLIDPSGKISKPQILRDIGFGCGEDTLRIIGLMDDWIPAEQDGQKVWTKYRIIVTYRNH